MIDRLRQVPEWDLCVIGGGATGLGVALDACTRGLKVVLLEKFDFAKGTSSRSTKLVHGGVRYLKQGNIKLVTEALHERGVLMKNAPHLVRNQSFIIPNYVWWEYPLYRVGLMAYDWMAGSLGLEPSDHLSTEETLSVAPSLKEKDLRGGIRYHDGQFDDSRLAIHLAMTAAGNHAVLLNYFSVTDLIKVKGFTCGVHGVDMETGSTYEIRAKHVINATGVFSDDILRLDGYADESMISPSMGIHIVVDRTFLPGETAVMIPRTTDGRVLFAVPWHLKVIIGTTDTPVKNPTFEPKAREEDIEFILQQMKEYFSIYPDVGQIRSVFAGLRPLIKSNATVTSAISREHIISVSESNLISIIGGKWTTYRKMAKDAVDLMFNFSHIPFAPSITENLPIHGFDFDEKTPGYLMHYGSDAAHIMKIGKSDPVWMEAVHPLLPYLKAEVKWAVENEMCLHVEDFLARRTRALFLDAKAAEECAPVVASIMAGLLKKNILWEENEISDFQRLAKNYQVQT